MKKSILNVSGETIPNNGTRRVQLLFVGNDPYKNLHDLQNEVESRFIMLIDALNKISKKEIEADAVVADSALDFLQLKALRKVTHQRNTPLIFYDSFFDQRTKDRAAKLGADEYFYGSMVYSLASRIRLVIRLREFKIQWLKHQHESIMRFKIQVPPILIFFLRRSIDVLVSSMMLILFLPIIYIVAIDLEIEAMEDHVFSNPKKGRWRKIYNYYQFIVLILLSPLFVIIAIPFRITPKEEHLFTKSKKVGLGFKPFSLYRFKTEITKWYPGKKQSTRLGPLLIKTGLVELPQLINVFKGDMSLIGSKPLGMAEAAQLPEEQSANHYLTQPGFTQLRHAH